MAHMRSSCKPTTANVSASGCMHRATANSKIALVEMTAVDVSCLWSAGRYLCMQHKVAVSVVMSTTVGKYDNVQ